MVCFFRQNKASQSSVADCFLWAGNSLSTIITTSLSSPISFVWSLVSVTRKEPWIIPTGDSVISTEFPLSDYTLDPPHRTSNVRLNE
jgi:hypothetical protein